MERLEVIDWKKFDWQTYELESNVILTEMKDMWNRNQWKSDQMAENLQLNLSNLVEKLAVKKTINTKHSRPWIDREMSNYLS